MSQNFGTAYVWFTGVVEDIADPEKMGRVRVRVFGLHTEKKELIATEDLPWATVMLPATASGISGIGQSHHGFVCGSWVVGFFRDSYGAQDPIIMGSIASVSSEAAQTQKGFYDPNGEYPKQEYIGQPDANKLSRGEDTETQILASKSRSRATNVPTSIGSWNEPSSPYAPEYPYNHVNQTVSGHIFEVDDTPGAERIHEYHKTGTFREIHPDGKEVIRIVNDKYEVIVGSDNCYVTGDVNLTIDSNCNMYVKKDWNVLVDGNMNVHVKGEVVEQFDKNQKTTVAQNVNIDVGGAFQEDIAQTSKSTIGSSQQIDVASSQTISVGSTQKIDAGNIDMNAGRIDMN